MSNIIPTPRSRSQLISDTTDVWLSEEGLPSVKIADPVFSLFEAVAQSQLRNQSDIFNILRAISLDYAEKQALDRIGQDELTPRLPERAATGYVTVSDSSFTKIVSKVFQGTAAPIVGSATLNILDGSSFPPTGSIYIGRGTENLEGPIAYTAITPPPTSGGSYYKLTLSTNTLKYHNVGEPVTLAQGGDRAIPAGTTVTTPQGTSSTAIQYKTRYAATLPDGETTLENVLVVAVQPGLNGNVAASSITKWSPVAGPFTGATVTNPQPFITGQAVEKDDDYRERIRLKRLSRSLGTPTAIQSNALGVFSDTDSKRVTSTSFLRRKGQPDVLYIDDGEGYLETTQGVAYEALSASADGGEDTFQLSNLPVAKARLEASLQAPYSLSANQKLAFTVENETTETTFSASQFRNIGGASAYEVVNAINQDGQLNWQAKLSQNGLSFYVLAKTDDNESIALATASANDSSSTFGFDSKTNYTLNLYKNDVLLTKDGFEAYVESQPFSNWGALSGNQSLYLRVDGILLGFDSFMFDKFKDQDFIDANTGYSVLGKNSLEAWVKVLNYRVPGITASTDGTRIRLTSNRARSSSASIEIITGDLVAKGVFKTESATGATSDYTLDRNTGSIELATPLASGDTLTAGSNQTEAFLESDTFTNTTLSNNADFWLTADGNASIISTGVQTASSVTLTSNAETGYARQTLTITDAFANVKVGDFLIVWDSGLPFSGVYRIRAATSSSVTFDRASGTASTPTLAEGGLVVVRSSTLPQKFTLPKLSGASTVIYTPDTVVTYVGKNYTLAGIDLQTYRTNALRVLSNKLDGGDIALVAKNTAAASIPLATGTDLASQPQLASSTSTPSYTPTFQNFIQSTGASDPESNYSGPNIEGLDPFLTGNPEYLVHSLFALPDSQTSREGNNRGFLSPVQDVVVSTPYIWELRNSPLQSFLQNERWSLVAPYQFASNDSITILADEDTEQKRYQVPLHRKISPTTSTYGATNDFTDAETGQSLAVAFGYGADSFDFRDFAVHMPARAVATPSVANTNALWRYNRIGPDGNSLFLTYSNPDGPSVSPSFQTYVKPWGTSYTRIDLKYGAGALKTGYTLPTGYPMGVWANNLGSTDLAEYAYILGYKVISFQRTSNVATVRLQYPTSGIKNSGLGTDMYKFVSSSAAPSEVWNFSGVTISEWVPASGLFDKFVFSDTGADVPLVTGNVGWLYFSSSSTASFTDGISPAAQNDYFRAEDTSGLTSSYTEKTGSILNTPGSYNGLYIKCLFEDNQTSPTVSSTVTLQSITDPAGIEIFSNAGASSSSLVSAWNALPGVPVQGVILDSGAGILTKSLSEDYGLAMIELLLQDGINWVKDQVNPATITDNYQLTFKVDIGYPFSDWLNEDVYLVPTTVKNLTDWFNCLGVSGLSSSISAKEIDAGGSTQLSTKTLGSAGSLWVQSGDGNAASAPASAGATQLSWSSLLPVDAEDSLGLRGQSWVSVRNTNLTPKTWFDSSFTIFSIGTDGRMVFSSGFAFLTVAQAVNQNLLIEPDGEYWSITVVNGALSLATVQQGMWVIISQPTTPDSNDINSLNAGIFRVHGVQDATKKSFWIKNPLGTTEHYAKADVLFLAADNPMPGDILSISTSKFGSDNVGNWVIADVGDNFTSAAVLTLDTSSKPMQALSTPTNLGSDSALFRLIEGQPVEITKFLDGVYPNPDDTSKVDLVLVPAALGEKFGVTAGTVVYAKGKAGFEEKLFRGSDAYAYNTGLLQEVHRIEYGDGDDPESYPGVISAGSQVNIEGSFIKRVELSLLVRPKLGFNKDAIASKVRSAVAAVVNGWAVGSPIPFSKIVAAAEKVIGVATVTIISPTYGVGNDRIPLQANQKARILDLDNDVNVSFTG